MAQIKFFPASSGTGSYSKFQNYALTSISQTAITGTVLSSALGTTPYRFEATVADGTTYDIAFGTNAGSQSLSSGTITSITWYTDDGAVAMRASNLNFSAATFASKMLTDGGNLLWEMITERNLNYFGSVQADLIYTGTGDDVVKTYAGQDYIMDMGGADTYIGGAGVDVVDYSQSFWRPWLGNRGIVVDLRAGTDTGPDGNTDTFNGIEQITGTYKNDVMRGNAADNVFTGFAGNDVFNGRGGRDFVRYDDDDNYGGYSAIVARLDQGFVTDGFGNRDRVVSIEGVYGTAGADRFFDDANDNYFRGNAGDDTFLLRRGNDYVSGGTGADTFVFAGADFDHNAISDFEVGIDHIKISAATKYADLTINQNTSGNAIIVYDSSSVELLGVAKADLSADDFLFA
ncbi:MAG: calcium-binding protein [Pseudomonadota bacterium]|nr:calcium-binding protein [Pseudomonadota bacterium]